MNTHDADSYFVHAARRRHVLRLPGRYGPRGGEEYAYRLRISAPQPDFALRCRRAFHAQQGPRRVNVYVIRKDGFNGPIKLG